MFRNILNSEVIDMVRDAELHAMHIRRPFHARDDQFDLSDRQFIDRYRLSKAMVDDLIDIVEERSVAPSRSSALNSNVKVLTALRFIATGSYQACIGDNIYAAIHQSSVSRSIRDVVTILNQRDVFSRWVHFPQNMEALREVRNGFYVKHNFLGVVGCIDCTHVVIIAPSQNVVLFPKHIYVNRKQYHSINVQLICDSTPWLLTPLMNPLPGTPEAVYNECLTSTRSLIERCNGLLKMQFRCLLKHRTLHYSPEVASKIINTCTILHNMCIEHNLLEPDMGDDMNNCDFGIYPCENKAAAAVENIGRVDPDLAREHGFYSYVS